MTTHLGAYQHLELAGPCWKIYGHWLDEWNRDPSKIRTDVYYPLKAADSAHPTRR